MPLYIASYDLNKKKDYPRLWAEFDRLGSHKPLESVYFLNVTAANAVVLRDHLRKFIDADDSLVVSSMTSRPATYKAKPGTKEWLDKNFPA